MAEKGLNCGINKTVIMATKITVPDIGDFESVEIIEILTKPGAVIKKNDPIVTLESDKSSVEVPSPFSGKISSLEVKIGDKVSKGSVLAIIEDHKSEVSKDTKKLKQTNKIKKEEEKPLILKEDEVLPETEKIIKQAETAINQSSQEIPSKKIPARVNGTDIDSVETKEWLDSLDAVIVKDGPDRAHYLPTKMTDGLCVNAVVKRNDPRDAFLSYSYKSFHELKPQSKIGTSSFRRQAQLNLLRNDIKIVGMRGNIDTRIRKLKNQEFDAIVLSLAGIKMLNLENEIKEVFTTDQMLPAIGQGAIALQCKKDDQKILNILKAVNDQETYYCIQAERALLETIGGDCDTAIGGLAKLSNEKISLKSQLFSNDGKKKFEFQSVGYFKEAKNIGYKVGKELLKKAGPDFTTQGN